MKRIAYVGFGILALLGCARVNVVAPKEAIKLDVSMRLDVYQHVARDVDNIEDMVSGSSKKTVSKNSQSFLGSLITNAYAEDGLGPDVQAAIERRKDRRPQLMALEAKGSVGEDASGLVEVKAGEGGDIVQAENSDRMIIYNAVAAKNGTSTGQVQQVYAKRLQDDAPAGTPVETPSGWTKK